MNYINKKIQLYPGDTYKKFGTILNVDSYGFTIKITEADPRTDYTEGDEIFISHSSPFTFTYIVK
jgi:hypothetical protein